MNTKKIIAIVSIMLCGTMHSIAQNRKNVVVLGDGKAFYKALLSAVYDHIDSLSATWENGLMYVRFNIGNQGIKNVKCSQAPEVLKQVVTSALLKLDRKTFKKIAIAEEFYVLPIQYQFATDGRKKTLTEMIKKLPEISENVESAKDCQTEFDLLFDIPINNKGRLSGIKCTLLPLIKFEGKFE